MCIAVWVVLAIGVALLLLAGLWLPFSRLVVRGVLGPGPSSPQLRHVTLGNLLFAVFGLLATDLLALDQMNGFMAQLVDGKWSARLITKWSLYLFGLTMVYLFILTLLRWLCENAPPDWKRCFASLWWLASVILVLHWITAAVDLCSL